MAGARSENSKQSPWAVDKSYLSHRINTSKLFFRQQSSTYFKCVALCNYQPMACVQIPPFSSPTFLTRGKKGWSFLDILRPRVRGSAGFDSFSGSMGWLLLLA